MKLVESLLEIQSNMTVLDNYLLNKDNSSHNFSLDRIRLGACFIAVKSSDGYKFYPSRFIGYYDNSMVKHEQNIDKDGKETNVILSKILNQTLSENKELEKEYLKYCQKLGIEPSKRKRKYWLL